MKQHHGTGIEFCPIDYKGRRYTNFFVLQSKHNGPGWFVFGENTDNGPPRIIHLSARPDVPPRAHPHYNIRVRAGWRLKRDAEAVARALNGGA